MSGQAPRMEGWLLLMLSSLIPIALIAFVPEGAIIALVFLAAVPLITGFGILILKHWPKN